MRRLIICAAAVALAGASALAQTQKPQPARQQAQKPAAQQPAAEQPQRPTRTETRAFDNWSVNCAEFEKPRATRCSASLQVVQQQTKQVIFGWTISMADDKKLVGALVTPTGVLIDPGIELKLGKAKARKVGYTSCMQRQCAGTIAVDEALVREATQADGAEATIQAVDGRTIRFTFPVKGIDRAVAQLRR